MIAEGDVRKRTTIILVLLETASGILTFLQPLLGNN